MAYRDEDFGDMDDDVDDISSDATSGIHTFKDMAGRTWKEDLDGNFISGSRDAYNIHHNINTDAIDDDDELHDSTLNTRGKTNSQLKMQRKLNSDKYKHDERMQKRALKEKFVEKMKTLKKDPRVRMISKIALAMEILKMMIDHHQDELANKKDKYELDKDKIEAKAGIANKAAIRKFVAANPEDTAKRANSIGLALSSSDAKQLAQAAGKALQQNSNIPLVNTINTWWNEIKGILQGGIGIVKTIL